MKETTTHNLLFLALCTIIFILLWNAPPRTTAYLPNDDNHKRFLEMKKKKAEKFCDECHGEDGAQPLSEEHPSKYRCLLCHKIEIK